MKDKILAFLKTKLNGLGVQDSYLNGVAETYSRIVKEEKDIETVITDGVIEVLKFSAGHIQVEEDRRTAAALKKYQDKYGLTEDGKPIKPPKPPKEKDKDADPDSDEPKWFTAHKEKQEKAVEELSNKLLALEKEKTTAQLTDKVVAKLKEKGIPASYYKGRNLIIESEDKLDQLITNVETDYNGFKQEMAEQGVVISVPPAGAGGVKEGELTGKSIAEKRNAHSSEGVTGKKI